MNLKPAIAQQPDPPRIAALVQRCWDALEGGRKEEAVSLGECAVREAPLDADAARALAYALWMSRRPAEARAALERLSDLAISDWSYWSDLGMLRLEAQEPARAGFAFARCVQLNPAHPGGYRGLAEALVRLHRFDEAAEACRGYEAAGGERGAGFAATLARIHLGRRDARGALAVCEAFLGPGTADATAELLRVRAAAWDELGCLTRAEADLARAVELEPLDFRAAASLALARWNAADVEGSREAWTRALELPPTDASLHSSLLWLAPHFPGVTAAQSRRLHEEAVLARTGGGTRRMVGGPHGNHPDPERRLRVGYLSGQFRMDPAFCFLACWLQHHDRQQVEPYFYSTLPIEDHGADAYRAMAAGWRDVWELTDEQLAAQIRGDQIDILVDLSGHYPGHRLGVFFLHPAPLQASFHHYPGTTGATAISHFFSDWQMSPSGSEAEYTEQLCRLPSGLLAFQLACEPPEVSPLPFDTDGFVTFGLFQRPGKYHAAMWDMVALILERVPGSRLLIHDGASGLDGEESGVRQRLLDNVIRRSVDPTRVLFRGRRPLDQHLRVIAEADIALDSFPYNGQTTTCDCLWMGVPVVNLRGSTHAGRVGQALLARVGLSYLSVERPEQYVAAAVRLAGEPDHLRRLRARLRRRSQAALGNARQVAAEVQEAYRALWRSWCEKAKVRE
jgi:predicted O-linked N-acetylglucosamine transferase (SPINDLY family)